MYDFKFKILMVDYGNQLANSDNLGLRSSATLSTKFTFSSNDASLDLCTYGLDPGNGVLDYTQCGTINAYKVNFVAYIDDATLNPASLVS